MATAAPGSAALSSVLPVLPESQAEEEEHDTAQEVLYGFTDLTVVGCRYYRGVAHQGEFVDLVREPNNPYDRNAIRVDNLSHQQVGHIKATQACVLASILDDRSSGAPRVEASVSVGGTGVSSLPIRANVFGPPERASSTIAHLARLYLKGGITGRPGSAVGGGGPSRAHHGHAVTVQKAVSNPVKTQRELDEMFDKLDADSPQLPTAQTTANIDPILATALMDHQKEGLAWMVQRENDPDPNGLPPFWEQRVEAGKAVFHNTITCSSQPCKPGSVRGGILSDDMGLGKTLQVIALMLAQPPAGADYIKKVRAVEENKRLLERLESGDAVRESQELSPREKQEHAAKRYKKLKKADLEKELASKGLDTKGNKSVLVERLSGHEAGLSPVSVDASQGTLVVCPMSVLTNWESQLAEHVKEGALDVYAYHGGGRNQDANFLAKKDVVITTYDTLASDFAASGGEAAFEAGVTAATATAATAAAGEKRKRRYGLMALGWNRIVLDEAHTIRNNKTAKHKACLALSSRYRWCLTGTPLVNKPEDVGALFSFLRLAPASNPRVFTQAIGRPIRSGIESGLARLRVLMKSVCLRRVKAILGDKLPPKVVEIHRVEMDDGHREVYNTLFNSARAAFKAALAEGESEASKTVMSQYASVLECLLRLRQVCCANSLVPAGRLEQARKVLTQLAKEGPKLGKEEAIKLFAKLKGLLEQDEGAECAVCLELVDAADARVLRGCGHGFCSKCLSVMVKVGPPSIGGGGGGGSGSSTNKCPLCRVGFTQADVVGGAELEQAGGNAIANAKEQEGAGKDGGVGLASASAAAAAAVVAGVEGKGARVPPPKVAALLQSLHELRQSGNSDKVVIFSQFTSFLDIIQSFLVADGFRLARLDGSMSNKQRKAELKRFASKGGGDDAAGAEVMLASLMAAGTGVNLTSANHCFICDPWWNASVESQAMDRVHRIGQTKPVRVVRMVSADSVEDRILQIQEAKEALGKGALRKLKPEEVRKARMTDLRTIFECKLEQDV
ncbi:unnamed protein product [Pylaiella littoralis]